jgi:hypothetical protein
LDSRENAWALAGRAVAPAGGEGAHEGHAMGAEGLPGSELWVARSTDGGRTFQELGAKDHDVCPCCRTGLAVGGSGEVYLVWRKIFAGGVRDIAIARSDDRGETFSTPVPVHQDGWVFPGCPHAGPAITVDDGGRVHVAWYTGREGAQGLFYAASADGGRSFGPPAAILADDWVPPSLVSLATRGSEVWIAWDDRRDEKDARAVYLARAKGGRLGRAQRIHSEGGAAAPQLALSARGGALAWWAGEGVQLRLLEER